MVVAVDPSGASGQDDERADEIGIVVAAKGDDGHAYVLADRSLRDAPAVWGRAAVEAYHEFGADRIVVEENFGGEMVRFVIRAADSYPRVHAVSASRGKFLRAEPVSALYEQGLVHHVGRFAVLEDQLCAFTTAGYRGEGSPDHADALVFAITELMLGNEAAIIEFYRRRAEDAQQVSLAAEESASVSVATGAPTVMPVVRLHVPTEASAVHGLSGTLYSVTADRTVEVTESDAIALIANGFTRIADIELH